MLSADGYIKIRTVEEIILLIMNHFAFASIIRLLLQSGIINLMITIKI